MNSKVTKAIKSAKIKLNNKATKSGIFENFGQKEVRQLKEKFATPGTMFNIEETNAIQDFNDWCMSYWTNGCYDNPETY